MHTTLTTIRSKLTQLIDHIRSTVSSNEPLGNAHNHWGLPGLTRDELIEEAQSVIDLINDRGTDDLDEATDARVKDYVRRVEHLRAHTVGQFWSGNGGQAVSAYMLTMDALRKVLGPALSGDGHAEALATLRRLTTKLRGMEAKVNGLEPRTTDLTTMVERIEQAYTAADELPTDMEALREARAAIEALLIDAKADKGKLTGIREDADKLDARLKESADEAKAVLSRCETAYSAATSVGLAAAFSKRSTSLSRSMWIWVAGLVLALGAGSFFGSAQLHALADLLKLSTASTSVIVLNLLLSLLSVGAPVWFAWLSTKQIGQRFRLAEDYAFKASISQAYEGYRREAARIDKDMEAQLLASALTRLDELPLRLVEGDSHGSPWHELASSDLMKEAFKVVPGFAEQVKETASKALSAVALSRAKAPPPTESAE